MTTPALRRLTLALAMPALMALAPPGYAFQLPDCSALERWSASYVPDETVNIAPQLQVTSLLADSKAVQLFGQPVIEWSQKDILDLRQALGKCRKAARKDKARAQQLYVALKELDKARSGLMKVDQTRSNLTGQLDRLLKYRPSPRLARQMALSQDALEGKKLDLDAHGLRDMPNWIAGFQRAADILPEEEIQGYVSQLAKRQAEIEQQFEKLVNDYAAAKKELADAPVSAEGMQTLDRLQALPWLTQLTPQEQDEFRNAINRKRNQYAQAQRAITMQAQRQQQTAVAVPDMKTYLDQLLQGKEVEDVTIKGLVPGVPKQQAVQQVTSVWGFKEALTLNLSRAYGKGNVLTEFKSMDDEQVGQVNYTARFKAPLNNKRVLETLVDRFGDAEKSEQVPAGQRLTWRDGDRILQVLSANRVSNLYYGYVSRLGVALWTEDYEDYLKDVNQRCGELQNTNMNELSLSDKQYMAGHCALMGKTDRHPGLEATL